MNNKTAKLFFYSLIAILALSVASCDRVTGNENENPDLLIPSDFDFATTRSVNVQVTTVDNFEGQYYSRLEIFDQNPFTTDTVVNLLAAGVIKGQEAFNAKIVLPAHIKTLFVRQTDPQKRQVVKILDIEAEESPYQVDFNNRPAAETKAPSGMMKAATAGETAAGYTLPDTYTTLGTEAVTLDGVDYYIPAGVSNSQINFGWKANSALYIAGELLIAPNANDYLPAGTKIVVLPGGKITANAALNLTQAESVLAIHQGGEVVFNAASKAENNTRWINDGTVSLNADFSVIQSSLMVNNGSLSATSLTLTNSSVMKNYGELLMSGDFSMNSSATLINNGSLETLASLASRNTTCVVENYGHIKALYLDYKNGGGQLHNYCSIEAEDFAFEASTVISETGTRMLCQDLYANNTTFTLNGNAILEVKNMETDNSKAVKKGATINFNVTIAGNPTEADLPLVSVWKIDNKKGWKVLQLDGSMEMAIAAGESPSGNYFKSMDEGVSLVEQATVVIAATDCNGGGVNFVPEDDPEDPEFPVQVFEGNEYTFAMEDLWPHKGDYDMNDFVFRIKNIQKWINKDNKVESMSFELLPVAAGSTKYLSAAIQFDDLATGAFSLIAGNENSRIEDGQEKATIILFEGVHELFGLDTPASVNTFGHINSVPAQACSFRMDFAEPVHPDRLTVDRLNFYMIVGKDLDNTDRKEVHLANFAPSSKVKKATNNYKDENNMVWAIMLPVGDFKHPTEMTNIVDAYPGFEEWAFSGGESQQDWYLAPADDEKLVYSR